MHTFFAFHLFSPFYLMYTHCTSFGLACQVPILPLDNQTKLVYNTCMTFLFDLPLVTFDNPDVKHLFFDDAGQAVCLDVGDNMLTPADCVGMTGEEVIMNVFCLVGEGEEVDRLLVWASANPEAVWS
jgi:hypothetical protein